MVRQVVNHGRSCSFVWFMQCSRSGSHAIGQFWLGIKRVLRFVGSSGKFLNGLEIEACS